MTKGDLVVVIAITTTYNSKKANERLVAALKTWVPCLGNGSDTLLVTDEDNSQIDKEILLAEYTNRMKANVPIYRLAAKKEGKQLRRKIIDTFNHASKMLIRNKGKNY